MYLGKTNENRGKKSRKKFYHRRCRNPCDKRRKELTWPNQQTGSGESKGWCHWRSPKERKQSTGSAGSQRVSERSMAGIQYPFPRNRKSRESKTHGGLEESPSFLIKKETQAGK